jgi:hypothetical protein
MRNWFTGMVMEDLEPIPGCPNQLLPIRGVKNAHPESYSLMPRLQHAIARLKCVNGVSAVVQMFRTDPVLRALAVDPESGEEHLIFRNGVKTACIWFVRGIPWKPGRRGGRCPIVNQDQVSELRDRVREQGLLASEDPAEWLRLRRRERFTPQLQAAMEAMMGLGAAQLEAQAIEQDTQRGRDWARGWLRGQGLNLKRAEALEAERWKFATSRTIRRWCEQDVEREAEGKRPQDLHTGSRVPTSPAFLAVLTRRLAPKEVAEAERHALRLERVIGPREVGLYDAEVQEMVEEEAEVDLPEPVPADFAKLTAVAERIDPSPPCEGRTRESAGPCCELRIGVR